MNISFIGFGNMAKAIAQGLIQSGSYTLAASAPSLTAGVNKDKIRTHFDNKEIVKDAEVVILAVKPIQMIQALNDIKTALLPNCLLISVAAGLNLAWYAEYCGKNQPLIRTMPNTPAAVGLSATPMIANNATSDLQREKAELIFSHIGLTTWVEKEEDMNVFTALSGSGPAYVFLFLEAMINAAVTLGLDETTAKIFTLQTFKGALTVAQQSSLSLKQLQTKVTSPNGTTAAALKVLHNQFEPLILLAMSAAKDRACELAIENSQRIN